MKPLSRDGFQITERSFSRDDRLLSIGLANIEACVPDIEANKARILKIMRICKEHKVNTVVFPELSLSGYFWEDEAECRAYMKQAAIEDHREWIDSELRACLDDNLRTVILNGLRRNSAGTFLNSTMVIGRDNEYFKEDEIYDKTFLPHLEKIYIESGRDDRLVVESPHGRFGFTTCYDCMFAHLMLEYTQIDHVDALVQIASWRAMARRDYPEMNVKTDTYYGYLWDLMMAAIAATNQVWVIACNAVGVNAVSGARFWGGSGIWAPSGLCLVQASRVNEEILIAHNIDIHAHREYEKDDFNYGMDFKSIYRLIEGKRTFTRADI